MTGTGMAGPAGPHAGTAARIPFPPPPLTRWGHVWRLVLTVVISSVAFPELARWQLDHARGWMAADLAIGLGCLVLVHFRRRHPVAVALLTALAGAVSASAAGPATLALASLATRRRWSEIGPLVAVSLVAGLVLTALGPGADPLLVDLILLVLAVALTVGWGMYIGSRRELLATLHERADRAEAEQAVQVTLARAAERARIAREMHDVLAHRISLITVHAGALAYREDLPAAQVHETAELIATTSHQALAELREVLGVLRDDPGDAAPERPQPDAADLAELVAEARGAGQRVDVEQHLALDDVPEGVGRTLYRTVQEALTNARKHAPGALVRLTVTGAPGSGVEVVVRNPVGVGASHAVRGPASGLGLVGLAERMALVGGRLTHGVTAHGEFVLSAWLPWPA